MKNLILLFCAMMIASVSFGQLKVISNGAVGLNMSSPTARLHVKNTGSGDYAMRVSSSNGTTELFEVQQGGVGSGNFFIYDAAGTRTIQFAGQGKFYISTPNNVGIDQNNPTFDLELGTAAGGGGIAAKPGGGPWAGTSDLRAKSGVSDYTRGLDELLQVKAVSYTYNGKFGTPTNGKNYVGVIAQDLQKIAPEMVITAKYNDATLEESWTESYNPSKHEEEFLTVDPNEFTYMLINSVQEQQEIIENQEDRIAELEAKIDEVLDLVKNNEILNLVGNKAALGQNRPNPFTNETTIDYFIPEKSSNAQIEVFNITGQLIETKDIDHTGVGNLKINAKDMASGAYSYRLIVDGRVVGTNKMILQN